MILRFNSVGADGVLHLGDMAACQRDLVALSLTCKAWREMMDEGLQNLSAEWCRDTAGHSLPGVLQRTTSDDGSAALTIYLKPSPMFILLALNNQEVYSSSSVEMLGRSLFTGVQEYRRSLNIFQVMSWPQFKILPVKVVVGVNANVMHDQACARLEEYMVLKRTAFAAALIAGHKFQRRSSSLPRADYKLRVPDSVDDVPFMKVVHMGALAVVDMW